MSALKSELDGLPDSLTPLCQLSAQSQARLHEAAEFVHYERGGVVFREGDTDGYAIYLLEGTLELVDRRRPRARHRAQLFGRQHPARPGTPSHPHSVTTREGARR